MAYFSDQEKGGKDRVSEEITVPVWNGIVAVFEKYKAANWFSGSFPKNCRDGQGISGFDQAAFEDMLKSEVPEIDVPISRKSETVEVDVGEWETETVKVELDAYPILDFLQFCVSHIQKPIRGDFHEFFKHYHLTFEEGSAEKEEFVSAVNRIFERNGIVFKLSADGTINRDIPSEFQPIINKVYNTSDGRLNELMSQALSKFGLPKMEDRVAALEKIWDAFERAKTYYGAKKNVSADKVLELASDEIPEFKQILDEEAAKLTSIGNAFQIRHFEADKVELKNNNQVDYLFYRMASLIHLLLTALETE